jgi:hypothetical protein
VQEIIKIINERIVESSLGWRIDILSIDAFQYQEQNKIIQFELEDSPDEKGEIHWIIYLPAIWRWKGIGYDEPIVPERIPEILNRIGLAFWKLDMNIKEIL